MPKVVTLADLLAFKQAQARAEHAAGLLTSDELWMWEHATIDRDPDKPGSVLFNRPLPPWTPPFKGISAEIDFVL